MISKVFVYKIEWYNEVFQIITHQPRGTNLFFLQLYLESTTSKCKCLCFGFSDLQREKQGKTAMTKKNFWKIYFFTFTLQSSKCLEIFRIPISLSKKEVVCVIQWWWWSYISMIDWCCILYVFPFFSSLC